MLLFHQQASYIKTDRSKQAIRLKGKAEIDFGNGDDDQGILFARHSIKENRFHLGKSKGKADTRRRLFFAIRYENRFKVMLSSFLSLKSFTIITIRVARIYAHNIH